MLPYSILCWVLCLIHYILPVQPLPLLYNCLLVCFSGKAVRSNLNTSVTWRVKFLQSPRLKIWFNFADLCFDFYELWNIPFPSASIGCGSRRPGASLGTTGKDSTRKSYLTAHSSHSPWASVEVRLHLCMKFQVVPSVTDGLWAQTSALSELDFAFTQLSASMFQCTSIYICLKYKYKKWSSKKREMELYVIISCVFFF